MSLLDFVKQTYVQCRVCTLIFSLVMYSCLSAGGWFVSAKTKKVSCVLDEDNAACDLSLSVGMIGFFASIVFLIGSSIQMSIRARKCLAIFDVFFSALWAFMFFVIFCYICNAWRLTNYEFNFDSPYIASAITFTFFSIFLWIICGVLGYRRYDSVVSTPNLQISPPLRANQSNQIVPYQSNRPILINFENTPLLSARNQRLTDVVPPNHKDFETAQSIFNEGQTKSHPFTVSLRLVKVERICNPALSKGYESSIYERALFHGTSKNNCYSIAENNFRMGRKALSINRLMV